MSRKDSEKDTERPHYYSQFWLDVAAGRRVIGAPRADEGAEGADLEPAETAPLHKPARGAAAVNDGYTDRLAHANEEQDFAQDELAEQDYETEEELEDNLDDLDIANAVVQEPAMAVVEDSFEEEEEPEPEPEDFYEDEEEEEDWNIGRGRKKPKPGRQTKQPSKKPGKPRRGGF